MTGRTVARADLDDRERGRMHALLRRNFSGTSRTRFEQDLEEKNRVVLLEDGERLLGFSTLLFYETTWRGRPLEVLCSGDTIVEPAAWGSLALARTWLGAVVDSSRRFYAEGLYWLLICSGYRTYRFLPVFWREFHPRPDSLTPEVTLSLLRDLAVERWGDFFDRQHGIVRLPQPQPLRPGISPLTAERLRDPFVGHFARLNPGHVRGDELVCLARLHPDNLTRAGRRILRAVESRQNLREAV